MKEQSKKSLTLKTLSKSNVWEMQENDIFRLWMAAEKDADLKDNARHYVEVIRNAFEIEEIKVDKPEVISKYEQRGFKVGSMFLDDGVKVKCAIKKRPIKRVTDLTYENIHHITATELIAVLDRNFGGGWDSLPQSIQDIIESGFDISTTTLPTDRLHHAGGMYERKMADGFEVLEITKGSWTEAIFAKAKPFMERQHDKYDIDELEDDANGDEHTSESDDSYDNDADGGKGFDDEKLAEETYRTTIDEAPGDIDISEAEIADETEY